MPEEAVLAQGLPALAVEGCGHKLPWLHALQHPEMSGARLASMAGNAMNACVVTALQAYALANLVKFPMLEVPPLMDPDLPGTGEDDSEQTRLAIDLVFDMEFDSTGC
eukprot:9880959-Alexandrium_andersonii.AAC.1